MHMFWSRLFMLSAVASLIALSSNLLPSPDERITMLIRDHKTDSAYEELNRLFDEGAREPHLLHQLTKLHEKLGDIESMKKTLLASLQHKPDDLVMREKLIELYFYTHDKYGYTEQLERHIDFHGRQKQLDRLLGYHKTLGNVQEEMRLSRKYLFKPFFANVHAERFAMLLINTGREDQGMDVFRTMDDRSHSVDHHWNARRTIFRYLIDQDEIDEAYQRAVRWASYNSNKNGYVIAMVEHLSARGLKDLALSLGQAALPHHPKLTFGVADRLIEMKHFTAARQILGQWRETRLELDERELSKYIDAVLQAQDLPAALASLNDYGFASAPQHVLLTLAEELVDQNQIPLLKTVLPFLSEEKMNIHPILAARIALLEGHKNRARHLLKEIEVAKLKNDQSSLWLSSYRQAFGEQAAYGRMNELVARRKLPLSLLRDFTQLANSLGRPIGSPWVWSKLGGRFPLNTLGSLSDAKDQADNHQERYETFNLASN